MKYKVLRALNAEELEEKINKAEGFYPMPPITTGKQITVNQNGKEVTEEVLYLLMGAESEGPIVRLKTEEPTVTNQEQAKLVVKKKAAKK